MSLGIVPTPDEDLQNLQPVSLTDLEETIVRRLLSSPMDVEYMKRVIDPDMVVDQVFVFEPKENKRGAGIYISFRDSQTNEPAEYGWRIGMVSFPGMDQAGTEGDPDFLGVTLSKKTDFRPGIDSLLGEPQEHLRTIIGSLLDFGGPEKLTALQQSYCEQSVSLTLASAQHHEDSAGDGLLHCKIDDEFNVVRNTHGGCSKPIEGAVTIEFGRESEKALAGINFRALSAQGREHSVIRDEDPGTECKVVQIEFTHPVTGQPICIECTEREGDENEPSYYDLHITGTPLASELEVAAA